MTWQSNIITHGSMYLVVDQKKLLCTWHVDRAWRKNIHKICDKNMQKEVYQMLRVLMEEMDSIKFHILLDEILKEWKNNELMSDFLEYFSTSLWSAATKVGWML